MNFEDDVERNYQYGHEVDENDETSDALISAFSAQNDNDLEKEVQQVIQKQGLSPREYKYEKFHFKKTRHKNCHYWKTNYKAFLL